MIKIEEKKKGKSKYNEDVDIDLNACSTQDCTGLIPSLPHSESERDSYKDLLHYEAEANVKNEEN